MYPKENARVAYVPAVGDELGSPATQADIVEAERQLSHYKGVQGIGISQLPGVGDVIIVYVEDNASLSLLPATAAGLPVVGEVVGVVKAY